MPKNNVYIWTFCAVIFGLLVRCLSSVVSVITFFLAILLLVILLYFVLLIPYSIYLIRIQNRYFKRLGNGLSYMISSLSSLIMTVWILLPIFILVYSIYSLYPKKFYAYKLRQITSAVIDSDNKMILSPFDVDATASDNPMICVSNDDLPEFQKKALILFEDQDFNRQRDILPPNYTNYHGFSYRSLYALMKSGGGSNINMQLIKNAVFGLEAPDDIKRKIIEPTSAFQLSYSEDVGRIITEYFNIVPFDGGKNNVGIYLAAVNAFGKSLNKINKLEMMYLAKTAKGNHGLNVFVYDEKGNVVRDKAGKKVRLFIDYRDIPEKKEIVERYLKGYYAKEWNDNGLITLNEYIDICNDTLLFSKQRIANKDGRKIFQDSLRASTRQFVKKYVGNEKLTYLSSLSMANEKKMNRAIYKYYDEFAEFKKNNGYDYMCAVLAFNVKDGTIIAHYSSDKVEDYARFLGGWPVASVFKPLYLLEFLSDYKGNKNALSFWDGPVPHRFTPKNYDKKYSLRNVDMETMIAKSLNAPFVNIRLYGTGQYYPNKLFNGIEQKMAIMLIKKDASLTKSYLDDKKGKQFIENSYPIGGRNMRLIDIAQIYQMIMNNGIFRPLTCIVSAYDPVIDKRKEFKQNGIKIYNEDDIEIVKRGMRRVIMGDGTARKVKELIKNKNAVLYAKTGTSDDNKHGYTVLSDGEICIVAHVTYATKRNGGYSDVGAPIIPYSTGGASAGKLAAYVYNEMVR